MEEHYEWSKSLGRDKRDLMMNIKYEWTDMKYEWTSIKYERTNIMNGQTLFYEWVNVKYERTDIL